MKIVKLKIENYTLTVGLEIHAELNTRTKMFCSSKNDSNEKRPNVNICPICVGYPGALPVINKEAVRRVLRLGTAVGGEIADLTLFDRKNYFYPDIPKGYQISQYKYPLVKGGTLCGVTLTRIHLEEDTARSLHDRNFQFPISNFQSSSNESISNENSNTENSIKIAKLKTENSLLDFNRAGVPLVELVTEPVIHDPETAVRFAHEFQLLLIYLGIAHANMEKGEMRVEANISVSKGNLSTSQVDKLGAKVEVKNLNSFKSVEKAIRYEFERQVKLIEDGGGVKQETRGWDEEREETFSQRAKEESHDYRYFPDPDLPKLFVRDISEFSEGALKASLPELPWQKRERYKKEWGIRKEDIEVYVTNSNKEKEFESVMSILKNPRLAQATSNYVLTDLKRPIQISSVAGTIRMVEEGMLSSRGAKDLLKLIPESETDARKFAKEKNLIQISDRKVLKQFVEEVLKDNAGVPIQFLVGQAMKKSQNRANPIILQELFLEMLDR